MAGRLRRYSAHERPLSWQPGREEAASRKFNGRERTQESHSAALAKPTPRPTLPAAHAVGAELPAAHHECSAQGLHAVEPSPSWNAPALHGRHEAKPASEAYEPGLQAMQADASLLPGIGLALPGSHNVHALLSMAPLSTL